MNSVWPIHWIVLLSASPAHAVGYYEPPCATQKEAVDQRKSELSKCADRIADRPSVPKSDSQDPLFKECGDRLASLVQSTRDLQACMKEVKGK